MKDNSMLKTKGAFNSSKVQKGKQLVQVKKKGLQMTAQLSRMLKHDKTKTVKNSETSLTDFLSNLWTYEVFLYAHLKTLHLWPGWLVGVRPDVSTLLVKQFSSDPHETWSQC